MAQVTLRPSTTESGSALADYFFTISGPSSVSVPIIISGYSATSDGGAGDSLSLGVAGFVLSNGAPSGIPTGILLEDSFSSAYGCLHSVSSAYPCIVSGGSFTFDQTLESDLVYGVTLSAVALPGLTGASALIDPSIEIDSSQQVPPSI